MSNPIVPKDWESFYETDDEECCRCGTRKDELLIIANVEASLSMNPGDNANVSVLVCICWRCFQQAQRAHREHRKLSIDLGKEDMRNGEGDFLNEKCPDCGLSEETVAVSSEVGTRRCMNCGYEWWKTKRISK